MPESAFEAEILEDEVVVAHVAEGHVFHFPILNNGTVGLHGARIEANPHAKREANRYLFDAHNAARTALEVEIWMLRQQINVLRRTAPKKQTFSAIDRLIFICLWRSRRDGDC